MEALIAVVQEVELVSNESWWSENIGPLVVAGAAVFAASLAAWIADRNHKRQLVHDRDLQNQDHIREVLDAANVSATDAHESVNDYLYTTGGSGTSRGELFNDAQAKINAINNLTHRLRVRLGEDSEIAKKHEAIGNALQTAVDDEVARRGGSHQAASTGASVEDEAEQIRWTPVKAAFREFRHECHDWFGGRPAQSFAQRLRTRKHSLAARMKAVR